MSIVNKASAILSYDIILYVSKIFLSILIARILGPELLGIYMISLMIPSVADSFGRFKFDVSAIYLLGKKKYSINEVIFTLNLLALITGIIIVVLISINFNFVYNTIFSKSSIDVRLLMSLVIIQIPFNFIGMNYSYLFIYKEDIKSYNRMVLIQIIFGLIFPMLFLILTNFELMGIFASIFIGSIVNIIYGIRNLKESKAPKKYINIELIKDLLKHSWKIYTAGCIGYAQNYIINLMAVYYLIPSQVGYLSLARTSSQLIERVPAALTTILYSKLVKIENKKDAILLTSKSFRIVSLILIILSIILSLIIYPAVLILYGEAFLQIIKPFLIIIPGIVLAGACTTLTQYFISINYSNIIMYIGIPVIFIQISFMRVLVINYEIIGAALSILIGLIVYSILTVCIYLKITNSNFKNLFINRSDFVNLYKIVLNSLKKFNSGYK